MKSSLLRFLFVLFKNKIGKDYIGLAVWKHNLLLEKSKIELNSPIVPQKNKPLTHRLPFKSHLDSQKHI